MNRTTMSNTARAGWDRAAQRVEEVTAAHAKASCHLTAAKTETELRTAIDAYDAAKEAEYRALRSYYLSAENVRAELGHS